MGARLFGLPADSIYRAKDALKRLRIFGALQPAFQRAKRLEAWLRAKGYVIRPLVPEADLAECQANAVAHLLRRDPAHEWGDYVEFGVFQGHSLGIAYRTLTRLGLLERVRLFGFDSFEGYPAEAADEPNGYRPGDDRAEIHVAQRRLSRQGIDWGRVQLVKGWFRDSLTPAFRQAARMERVSIVNFDCDLYSSTAEALEFVAPLVGRSAIFLFDDWGPEGLAADIVDQKRAFVEYLEAEPDIYAEQLPGYSAESLVFCITRGPPGLSWPQRITPLLWRAEGIWRAEGSA